MLAVFACFLGARYVGVGVVCVFVCVRVRVCMRMCARARACGWVGVRAHVSVCRGGEGGCGIFNFFLRRGQGRVSQLGQGD